jgi:hypothetical protein
MTRTHVYRVNQTVPAVRNGQTIAPVVTTILFFMITSVMLLVPYTHMRQKIIGVYSYVNWHYMKAYPTVPLLANRTENRN